MMNDNSCKSVKTELGSGGEDWRSELKPDFRGKVVNKVVEKLKNQLPSCDPKTLNQLKEVAMKFEEKIYRSATMKDDYMIGICEKIMPIEKSCNQRIAASSSNPGLSQTTMLDAVGNCSNLQNVSGFLHDIVDSSAGQGMQSNILANTQTEMTRSQLLQPAVFQQQQQPLLKQKVHQANIYSSFMQPNICYSHHNQQPKQILSQPIQPQTSQQSMLPTQQHQQLMMQHPNTTVFQQKQHLGQQNKVPNQHQQSPLYQKNVLNSFRQPLGQRSNVSGMQQQQKMVGSQPVALNMQPQQHSSHVFQQEEVSAPQQKAQQTSQPAPLHQLPSSKKQSSSSQEDMEQRIQMSAALLQPQNATGQQKQLLRPHKVLPEASSGQTQLENVADWHDQAYQKLQSMREMCLPELVKVYRKAHGMCLQATDPEVIKKLKNNMVVIEKMIKLLQISRSDIVHCSKEKLVYYQQMIIKYLNSIRSKNPVSVQHHNQQLQPVGGQSQIPQQPQHRDMKLQFHTMNAPLTSNSVGSSPVLSTQQGIPNLQINMINAVQSGSQMGSEQRNAPSTLQHGSASSICQNIVSASQQANSSHNTNVNASQKPMSLIQPSSNIIPLQHLKQQKHQVMQPQKLKQQVQQQWIQQKRQQMLPEVYEANDLSVRQSTGVSSGMLQQHHSTGQHFGLQQPLLPATLPQSHTTSLQTSQHSSAQIDQQNLLPPLSKARKLLQSASSPCIVASPATPLTSSIPVELEKHPSGVSPLSSAENVGHPQTPVSVAQIQTEIQIQDQCLAIGTPGLSVSPLLTEFTSPDANQQSTEKPLERLLKAVKSMSSEALSASVRDIGSVVSMIDRIAGTTNGKESRVAIVEDLSAKSRGCLQERNFSLQYGCSTAKMMKRHVSAMTLDLSPSSDDSFKQPSGQISESESTATSRIKRCRTEPNNALLEEIRGINQQLVETVIDVVLASNEDAVTTEAGEGTIVRCSYSAVALSKNFSSHCASSHMLPTVPLRLLVPTDYPNCSPIVLDRLPIDLSQESEDLSEKAKSRFYKSLCNLSQPISLEEMVRTWDVCARSVFSEYAQLVGGGCFSSRYGSWENCVTA